MSKHIIATTDVSSRKHSHIEKLLDDGYEILNIIPTTNNIFFILKQPTPTKQEEKE